jgi:hypothetical protein
VPKKLVSLHHTQIAF